MGTRSTDRAARARSAWVAQQVHGAPVACEKCRDRRFLGHDSYIFGTTWTPCPDCNAGDEGRGVSRSVYLHVAERRALQHWCRHLRQMFPDASGVYLVGSTLRTPRWRDVDVRIMFADNDYDALRCVLRMEDLNMLLSQWGRAQTGLPIDCQVQDTSRTNAEHDGPRSAEGVEP